MASRFGQRAAGNVILLAFSLGFSVVAAEAALRLLDGFSLTSFRLVSTRPVPVRRDTTLADRGRRLMQEIPTATGVERAWFDSDPLPLSAGRQPDEALASRYRDHPEHALQSLYVWNRKFVLSEICSGRPFQSAAEDVYIFDSPSGAEFPRYRYPAGRVLPNGLVTNDFGWRGPALSLNRPARTIRVAFVGASTTVNNHGYPFSYPEHILHWLNLWSRARNYDIRFEVINAAREGTNSEDFQAIVRDELMPVDPDLVVYYEGSNQFWPVEFVVWSRGAGPSTPAATFVETFFSTHSAIGRRLTYRTGIGHGREPSKPFGRVDWPASLDEFDPDPADPGLPLQLPTIITDIDAIRATTRQAGGELVLSSFVWLAYDGMVLELPHQKFLYDYLNQTFGAFPYAHIRRMANFQNRVFRNVARRHGDGFLDVSAFYPQDPALFDDAIHMNPTGIRLHAWIALQQLVPLLEDRIASGRLPRPPRDPQLQQHPGARPPVLTPLAELKRGCGGSHRSHTGAQREQ